jgi:hypothetical protein
MGSLVSCKFFSDRKCSGATVGVTGVRLFFRMQSSTVDNKVDFLGEYLAASFNVADIVLLVCVNLSMNPKVTTYRKCGTATVKGTDIRLLACMFAPVLHQSSTFRKRSLAIVEIAHKRSLSTVDAHVDDQTAFRSGDPVAPFEVADKCVVRAPALVRHGFGYGRRLSATLGAAGAAGVVRRAAHVRGAQVE